MAKKKRATPQVPEPEPAKNSRPLWESPWLPAVLFGLASLLYFNEFVFSDKVIFGLDIGTDYHQGKEPIGEKLARLVQPQWINQLGGLPESEGLRWQYFPTYLIYLFTTFQRHIGWRYILTVFAAGGAMFLYLRALGVGRWVGFWGGLAYMSAPVFLGFTFAGHYAKMAVISLFPLMCLLLDKGMDRGRLLYFAALAGLISLGIYSPHLQMLYHALWGLGFYLVYKLVALHRAQVPLPQLAWRTGFFALAVAFGLGLGAEGLIPSYLYTRTESQRAAGAEGEHQPEQQLAFARSWSLHPEEVGSLLVPEWGGFQDPRAGVDYYWGRNSTKLNSEYFGALVLLLALVGMRRQILSVFLVVLFVFALAYALGPHTPVHWLFFQLVPGVKVLRTPGMIAFLFAFAACVLAALGLERFVKAEGEEAKVLEKRLLWIGGGLAGLTLLVAIAPEVMTGIWTSIFYSDISEQKRQTMAAGRDWLARGGFLVTLVLVLGGGLLFLQMRRRLGLGLLIGGLCLLTLADTWRIDRVFLRYEDPRRYPDQRQENRQTVDFMEKDGQVWRFWPLPDYNMLKQAGYHLHGVPSATGFHDFKIRRYARILDQLAPLSHWMGAKYYNGQEIPYTNEALLEAVQPLLSLLNVAYVTAPKGIELKSERYPPVWSSQNYQLYHNPAAIPWFHLAASAQVVADEEQAIAALREGTVDLRRTVLLERQPPPGLDGGETAADEVVRLAYEPEDGHIAVKVRCKSPRMLVIAENFHSNWSAFVNGQPVELFRANYVWQAVYVPAGEHRVELRYDSKRVFWSRILSAFSLLALVAIALWDRRRPRAEGVGDVG